VSEQCACGRTLRRIRRIGRRSDDMFIIRGVNVFPSQVETALLRVEGTLPHYQIILTRDKGLDQMEVKVEVTPEVFSDEIRKLEALQHKLEASIENILGLRVKVTLVQPRSLARARARPSGSRICATSDESFIAAGGAPAEEELQMKLQQLSLFLENKPGQLRAPCEALAAAGIDLLTMSLADTTQFGILRFIVATRSAPRRSSRTPAWSSG
jgi:acyl-CoA synthetase (AMP-forming)/AMP-acid ligase II